jgi:hypothetical protein
MHKPISFNLSTNEVARIKLGGVYSDGPRSTYLKLNKEGQAQSEFPRLNSPTSFCSQNTVHPLPSKIRKQQSIIRDLHLRVGNEVPSFQKRCAKTKGREGSSSPSVRKGLYEVDSARRVWNGVVELGVMGEGLEEQYVERITHNENREVEACKLREQCKRGNP